MGCNNTKERRGGFNSNLSKEARESGAEEFTLLAAENPVAAKLREEWSKFVRSIATMPSETRKEVWANTVNDPLTHASIDKVGKLFLVYIRNDLTTRGWGGDFDYAVVGVAKQGFLKATVTVNASSTTGRSGESLWEIKVHYHSTPKS